MRSDAVSQDRPVLRYRPGIPVPERRRKARSRRKNGSERTVPDLVLDMPERPRVSTDELAVIETYLADQISELLTRCSSRS
ncbi:hypothetical protein PZ897_08795 [Hoeflea sp. YIM 152468]|uniref:hypothetical protein n=1 Tax=Hoeflea sp. YIM 152468 TaxID=3031759 RepID=UPI0023DC074B|nr:hypothetical protein [Hoeflea sp. YIM 152468]MDF1608270.1 hypothetical protein [Hoeflea sp. YIM 152468]